MADLFDAEPMYDADYLHFWGSGQRLDDTAPSATPRGDAVADLDLAWLTDRFRVDPLTNRLLVSRTIVRDGRARRVP